MAGNDRAQILAEERDGEWAFSYSEKPTRFAGLQMGLGRINSPMSVDRVNEVLSIMDRLVVALRAKDYDNPETVITISWNQRGAP